MPEYLFQLPPKKHIEILGSAYSPTVALIELIKNASDACIKKKDTISVNLDSYAQTITISDNGSGFSLEDFEKLKEPTDSKKMKGNNIHSAIGEPYAGSKGMGILTAFTLCEELQINTFSLDDNVGYKLAWKKEDTTFNVDLAPDVKKGTTLTLVKVPKEVFNFIIDEEEFAKIAFVSITYFEDSATLPSLELRVDGQIKNLLPHKKIDEVYKHEQPKYDSRKKRGFVAKVSFKYENNMLTLSHTDHLTDKLNFTNEQIDLSDQKSIYDFITKFKIHDPKISKWYNELSNYKSSLDPFSGVFYVWRDAKTKELAQTSCGIPIYVNNYGLYDFLDRTNDWLQLTQRSQREKSTDYKFHNTYGFIHFHSFNESHSHLKISNERQNFMGNTAYKKFQLILRKFVVNILFQMNIALRNEEKNQGNQPIFKAKANTRRILLGDKLTINDLIKTNVDLSSISTNFPQGVIVDTLGEITFLAHGDYSLKFTHESTDITVQVIVKPNTPTFELNKGHKKTVDQGSTINLQDFINSSSLVNIKLEDIDITSKSATIAKKHFSAKNLPATYDIVFTYNAPDGLEIQRTTTLEVTPLYTTEANKVKKLFPNYSAENAPQKMTELIDGISMAYTQYPLISMIAIRCLVETGLREFQFEYLNNKEAYENSTQSLLNRFDNLADNAFAPKSTVPTDIQNKFKKSLTGAVRKNLRSYIEKDTYFNFFVHNPRAVATSSDVLQSLKKLQNLLNFLIDAIRLNGQSG